MAKTLNFDNPKDQQGCGAVGSLPRCPWEYRVVQPRWKMIGQHLLELNIELPPRSSKTSQTCTQRKAHLCEPRVLLVNAHSGCIQKSPKLRTSQTCVPAEWVGKLGHPCAIGDRSGMSSNEHCGWHQPADSPGARGRKLRGLRLLDVQNQAGVGGKTAEQSEK